MDNLQDQVRNAAPRLDPPNQYWLESEGSISYCRKCAIEARGKEFELGPLIAESEYVFYRDQWEDAFFQGIGCYAYGASPSDSTEQCETCGVTLDYCLTDYGIAEEIDHWSKSEMSGDISEIAYNIDALFECDEDDGPALAEIAQRFLEYAATTSPKSTAHVRGEDGL